MAKESPQMSENSSRARPEIPQPDYDDPKEVYAFCGLAIYCAQLLEQGITNLLVGLGILGKKKPTWGMCGIYMRWQIVKPWGNYSGQ